MLAYVFWHWPQPGVDIGTYVEHLISFHRTFADNKPAGFRGSRVFRIRGASWLDTKGDAFEDWYLLDDSAALDVINHAAVSGPCEEPHNLVAREAAGGTAGLYRLRIGEIGDARYAVWLAKPAGVSYPDFFSTLEPIITNAQGALWGRQMTLGPTTEFVIHSMKPIELPQSFEPSQALTLQSAGSDPTQL
jgi:hypothetical protein